MGHPAGRPGPEARFLVHVTAAGAARGPSSPGRPRCTQRLQPAAFSALPTSSAPGHQLCSAPTCSLFRSRRAHRGSPPVDELVQNGLSGWGGGAAGGPCLQQTRGGREKRGRAFTDELTNRPQRGAGRESGAGTPAMGPPWLVLRAPRFRGPEDAEEGEERAEHSARCVTRPRSAKSFPHN